MSRAVAFLSSALTGLALAAPASGAGGPPIPYDTGEGAGVVRPDGGGPRYATVSNGSETTVLQIDQDGGEILASREIDGAFSVPVVGTDGTPGGLSGDGTRLVLAEPRLGFQFPRERSSFVVVDIRSDGRMRVQQRLTLPGDFSFDALSPNGLSLFLIEYPTRKLADYVVREYDFAHDGLVDEPVLVPDEEPGDMRGLPITRATSVDGRWEYTLYDGGGGEPFIHGLDTVDAKSVCIDLPQLEGIGDVYRTELELPPGSETLSVTGKGGELLATVDTETHAVSDPPPEPRAPAEPAEDRGAGGLASGAIAAGIALVAGTALGLRRRRRSAAPPLDRHRVAS